jgi:hypothetical protein
MLKKLSRALLALWLPFIGGPGWSADGGKPAIVVFAAFKTYGFIPLH